jgi:hypothetical protein
LDYFSLFSNSFAGVISTAYMAPAKEFEKRLKRTEKLTEP